MTKHILKIREVNKFVFDAIKKGQKTIETRAATERYGKIKTGDIAVFTCGKEKIEKKIKIVKRFKSIDAMVKKIAFKKIMPFCNNVAEMKKVYLSFPGYKEKIKKFGLITFDLK